MALVTFKSRKEYFYKEKSDSKNSTTREVDSEDNRFTLINQYGAGILKRLDIDILCVETQDKFRRHVRDVTYLPFGEKQLVQITWDEKGGKKE